MRTIPLLLIVLGMVTFGQAADAAAIKATVETKAKPWTGLTPNVDKEMFRFAVISDNTGTPRSGILTDAFTKLNLLQPEFVMCTGDLIEGYEDTREQIERQWELLLPDLGKLEMPFFFTAGNHDSGRPLWSQIYAEHFGTQTYHFVYKDVLFMVNFTNDGPENNTGMSQQQIDAIAGVLREHKNVRWTFMFQHKPLWNENNKEWGQVAALLKGRQCTVFAGHTHNYLSQEKDGVAYITQSTTGGDNRLRGPAMGEFDGIVWVTMTKNGPRVANLVMDGILDTDFRTPEKAKELALFSQGQAIVSTAVQAEGTQFESGISHLTITNPSTRPLRVKILSETQAGVHIAPGTVATVIPGKAKHEVDLRITADAPVPTPKIQPVVLHWTATYDSENNTPGVSIRDESRIVIDAPYMINPVEKTPVVDGKLDDWNDLAFTVDSPASIRTHPEAWKGPQDCSYRFDARYDSQYVYVGINVIDDDRCFEGWKQWEDFAMLYVDARAKADGDPKSSVFCLLAGPKVDSAQAEAFQDGTIPEGVKIASTATENGYEVEVAIPVAWVNAQQEGEWKRIRLNLAINDYDTRDARDGMTILSWRPNWKERKKTQEFGVFTRK